MMLGFGGKMSSQIATQGCHEVSGNYLNSNNKSERFKRETKYMLQTVFLTSFG